MLQTFDFANRLTKHMLLTYLKIAFRNLYKTKLYSFINLAGLTIAILCCLLIALFVQRETGYDSFHKNAPRIVLLQQFENSGVSGGRLAADMRQLFSQVENTVRLRNTRPLIKFRETGYYERNFYFADSTVFSVFSFPLSAGDPNTALKEKYGVVISEAMAQKYFQGRNALGQELGYNNAFKLHVTGILKNLPGNSHLHIDFLTGYTSANEMAGMDVSNNYWGGDTWTYLLLSGNADLPAMERKIPGYLRQLNDPNAAAVWKLHFLPLKDIYLKSSLIASSPITYVYVFTLIGFFILALACFNYINLSTARASTRAKEVGVRKVMGSSAGKLRWQFILETAVFVTGAVIIAWLLLQLGLPAFNRLAAETLSLKSMLNTGSIVSIIAAIVLVSMVAGIYPAFMLSSFRPAKVLKGDSTLGQGRNRLRKTLVVVQFAVSTVMIAATIIVYQQLHFIRSRDLGYQREQILTLDLRDAAAGKKEQFTGEVAKLSLVKAVSRAYSLPGSGILQGMKLVSEYVPKGSKDASIRRLTLDEGYLKTFGIGLAEGRMLNTANPSDKGAFMINEAAKEYFQWKDINGKMTGYYTFRYKNDGSYEEVPVRGPVVGVIKDYNHADLSSPVEPMIISLNEGYESQTAIRITPGSAESAVQQVKQIWREFFPEMPFDYGFLDASFENTYRSEKKLASLFSLFASLAILISCLGVLGLMTHLAEVRRKEIGIRKVLGASVTAIVSILVKEFTLLVIAGWIIAFPIAWWSMNKWLEHFAFRINLAPWILLLAGGLAMLVAMLTIGIQAFTAAKANPIKNLRTE